MEKEIIEGNKLIAEFMGLSMLHNQTRLETLKYHSSWDWLMPVVEKIEQLLPWKEFKIYRRTAYLPGFYIGKGKECLIVADTKIEAVWIAVVKFIKNG